MNNYKKIILSKLDSRQKAGLAEDIIEMWLRENGKQIFKDIAGAKRVLTRFQDSINNPNHQSQEDQDPNHQSAAWLIDQLTNKTPKTPKEPKEQTTIGDDFKPSDLNKTYEFVSPNQFSKERGISITPKAILVLKMSPEMKFAMDSYGMSIMSINQQLDKLNVWIDNESGYGDFPDAFLVIDRDKA